MPYGSRRRRRRDHGSRAIAELFDDLAGDGARPAAVRTSSKVLIQAAPVRSTSAWAAAAAASWCRRPPGARTNSPPRQIDSPRSFKVAVARRSGCTSYHRPDGGRATSLA